jgi:hypothetical protein
MSWLMEIKARSMRTPPKARKIPSTSSLRSSDKLKRGGGGGGGAGAARRDEGAFAATGLAGDFFASRLTTILPFEEGLEAGLAGDFWKGSFSGILYQAEFSAGCLMQRMVPKTNDSRTYFHYSIYEAQTAVEERQGDNIENRCFYGPEKR